MMRRSAVRVPFCATSSLVCCCGENVSLWGRVVDRKAIIKSPVTLVCCMTVLAADLTGGALIVVAAGVYVSSLTELLWEPSSLRRVRTASSVTSTIMSSTTSRVSSSVHIVSLMWCYFRNLFIGLQLVVKTSELVNNIFKARTWRRVHGVFYHGADSFIFFA